MNIDFFKKRNQGRREVWYEEREKKKGKRPTNQEIGELW